MNKLYKLTLCFVFALLLNIGICYASTSEAISTSQYLDSYSKMLSNKLNSPYQYVQSDGYVNTSDANMTVNVEDLYISGKNGLDLSIKRHFNVESSPMDVYWFQYKDNKNSIPDCYTRTYICQEENHTLDIYFYNELNMYEAGDSFKGKKYNPIAGAKNYYNSLHDDDGEYTYNISDERDITEVYKDVYYIERRYSFETSDGYIDLDKGWTLQLPALVKYDLLKEGSELRYYLVFQDRLGNMYDFSVSTYKNSSGKRYLHYIYESDGEFFIFSYYNNSDVEDIATHSAGFEYNIIITANNGDKYYFLLPTYNYSKYYIKAIEDRYGNIMTFSGDNENFTINDTYGYTYTIDKNGIKKGTKELVKYSWQSVNGQNDTYNEFTHDNENIFTVVKNSGNTDVISDNEPNKTVYYHRQEYQVSNPIISWKYLMYHLPYKIETPSSLTKHFEYEEKWGWSIG